MSRVSRHSCHVAPAMILLARRARDVALVLIRLAPRITVLRPACATGCCAFPVARGILFLARFIRLFALATLRLSCGARRAIYLSVKV